ncbi:acetyl-CoA C-acyltransferase FadA [Acinetobacter nectaris]|uniref:acetyl-CoA C-acyltransferase FadA n=1 Tax=Acinetobacter nectaris TaxID=1219382 RepID=UPI001F031B6B|nr:acetyl-CoA C-acyltransferase FadA [Acinetobacter nectaris]MCF9047156.1 acetyl-CoA C-acyltransferase FadA [Acinetobacter nectaris]
MAQLNPRDVVIVDAARTAMAKTEHGMFRHIQASELSAVLIQRLLERNQFNLEDIEDVIWGCVHAQGEENIARKIALLAQLPKTTAGQTVNRLDGSSMQALHNAVAQIATQQGDIFIVGGVEHTQTKLANTNQHLQHTKYYAQASHNFGLTAEIFARMNGITREQQDIFALQSHQRAWQATQNGAFAKEVVTIAGHNHDGFKTPCKVDEVIQPHLTLSELQALQPLFDTEQGIITSSTSAQTSSGASALLVMSAEHAKTLNLKPRAVIRATAVAGCDDALMGYGAVPATQKALKRAGLSIKNIQTIELHETFAAQTLAVLKNLDLFEQQDKVNIHGGAIALGHPIGCSGTRLITSLLHIMEQKKTQFGLATMSIGLGQGISTIIERL